MKTQVLILALISAVFTIQIQGQNRSIVQAQNSEISDNLDLRVVASIFGDSRNLNDFERQLNDPKLQISNLDLNSDGQVDYLRVIESVNRQTHLVIIQAVLDRDLYQDVASIEVEKNWLNNIQIQVVGNPYFYGQNYIYEPVFFTTPLIYADFWVSNYRPYCSNWNWNYYPSYYYSWNTYPIFRYRKNVNITLNNYNNNHYYYVNYRRSSYAAKSYNSSRSNGYERQNPDYSFSRRNTTVSNHYELDQIRSTRNGGSRNGVGYSQNRSETPRESAPQRTANQSDYSQTRTETPRESTPQRTENHRDDSQTRSETPRESTPQRTENQRDYSQTRSETPRESTLQRTGNHRDDSQTRTQGLKENNSSRNSSSAEIANQTRVGNRRT